MYNRLPCGLAIFLFFLVLTSTILTYGALAAQVSAQTSLTREEGNLLTYLNSDYGIKIQYPYNWKKSPGDPSFNQIVLFSAPEVEERKSSTLITIYTPAEVVLAVENISDRSSSLKEYTDRYIQRASALANDFQITNASNSTLAGNPAQKIISEEIDITGHISEAMRIVAIKDGIAYRIGYYAEPETFSDYLPIAQRLIDSFEITGKPNSDLIQEQKQQPRPLQQATNDLQSIDRIQDQNSGTTSLSTQQKPLASNVGDSLQQLPQNILLSDNSGNNAELPLRSAILSGNATDSGVTDLPEGNLFGYNPLLTIHFLGRPNIGLVDVGNLLIGQIKTYESLDDILDNSLYWENVPLNDEIVLRLDHAGLNYVIASVRFANGTSGIYSSIVNIEPDQTSKSLSDYWFEQDIGEGAQFNIMESSDVADIVESNPIFYQKASTLICSHLENYGFQICREGAEDAISEDSIGSSDNEAGADGEVEEDDGEEGDQDDSDINDDNDEADGDGNNEEDEGDRN